MYFGEFEHTMTRFRLKEQFLPMLILLQSCLIIKGSRISGDAGPNSPIFDLDHTDLEKDLAAIFNKVAHSSATTKRSVPAYDAQISAATTVSTLPSPLTTGIVVPTTTEKSLTTSSSTTTTTTTPTTTMLTSMTTTPRPWSTTTPTSNLHPFPSIRYPVARATASPSYRELPSYAPPSRGLFTPPLPPEYLHPFADKPTLRGTNSEVHSSSVRRPMPPPSLTPAHERIPIRPPDLPQGPSQSPERHSHSRNKASPSNNGKEKFQRPLFDHHSPPSSPSFEIPRKNHSSNEFVPTNHYPSISRILSGSNGRKQDIPDILLKPLHQSTRIPSHHQHRYSPTTEKMTTISSSSETPANDPLWASVVTQPTIFNLPNTRREEEDSYHSMRNNNGFRTENIEIVDTERLPYPQPQPPAIPSKRPEEYDERIPHSIDTHPLESTWRIAWSLHVYVAAIMFTLMALYSIYKIVRFNEATNLLTQSYFLSIHLLLTSVCTLRCFHLFYDAYNLGESLPKTLSTMLMDLPGPLLSAAFATLILYLSRCSEASSLNNRFLSPGTLILASTMYILLCVFLHVPNHLLGYQDAPNIFTLICQYVYIVVCLTLGFGYMYIYRIIRSQLQLISNKAIGGGSHVVSTDPMTVALSTAITTSIATGLLFILMGFDQLYGIFWAQERLRPYPWVWWGWEFSVRLLELSVCGLLAWVASLSQYPLREKQLQQHSTHSGFALFPCGSSTSTENMDDVLYPAICSTNQAIQNYTMRTGKQVYDDSFPLNTLPEHLNISGTFERHSVRKSGTMNHFPHDGRGSLGRHGNGVHTMRNSESRSGRHTPVLGLREQQVPTSGSTMLVAEDGFVRFRSLGGEDDELSDTQSIVGTHGRGSSLAGSVRFNTSRHSNVQQQQQQQQQQTNQYNHQHQQHLNQHQALHQLYNNT